MNENADWATRLKENPDLLKEVPIKLLPDLHPVLLSPELSGRYYLFALALIQRADVDTRTAWMEAFRHYMQQFQPGDEVEVFSLLLWSFVIEFLATEVRTFGGLRQDCPPVREELWRFIVELQEIEPMVAAPIAREAVVR
jgi:hypothetical protein